MFYLTIAITAPRAPVTSLCFKYRVVLLRFYQFLSKYWISSSDYLFEENCSKMTIQKITTANPLFSCNFLIKINKIWTLSCYKIIIVLFFKSKQFSFVLVWSYHYCVTMDIVIEVGLHPSKNISSMFASMKAL